MKRIAIFASGSGTNAENIANYLKSNPNISICRIYCNNPKAFVIERAKKLNTPVTLFSKSEFKNPEKILVQLIKDKTDFIVLAGFLWLIPVHILRSFPNKIINIHPALLPKFGGKGMYGSRVHEAVIAANEELSGITVHYVNENYDEGEIIFQATCKIDKHDTPDSLASKIHVLEYKHYPEIIQKLVESK
ncbi:MAG: phosphoribosylglycinamide formyltransferase [Bacteroidales bacterium]|nr:phosphoribosylglycinamide formyltransferase [Bacteroidales bacterium]